jgi:hypothetical protein
VNQRKIIQIEGSGLLLLTIACSTPNPPVTTTKKSTKSMLDEIGELSRQAGDSGEKGKCPRN